MGKAAVVPSLHKTVEKFKEKFDELNPDEQQLTVFKVLIDCRLFQKEYSFKKGHRNEALYCKVTGVHVLNICSHRADMNGIGRMGGMRV